MMWVMWTVRGGSGGDVIVRLWSVMTLSSCMILAAVGTMTVLVVRCGNAEAHQTDSDQNDLSTNNKLY
jgi:hypothetical protein